jgi:asparagine synthase (glutamine-hydrolysing)
MYVTRSGSGWRIRTERYWSINYAPKFSGTFEDGAAALRSKVREAVQLRLTSDVPLGAFLSGGIDSALVVGIMAQELNRPIETFSIGFINPNYDERARAREVATRWETNHHEEVVSAAILARLPDLVTHYGEPFADVSALPTWQLAKLARRDVTVALNGDGGDESFAGYERFRSHKIAERLRRVPGCASAARSICARVSASKASRWSWSVRRVALSLGEALPTRHARWLGTFRQDEKPQICRPDFLRRSGAAGELWMKQLFSHHTDIDVVDAAMAAEIESKLPYGLLPKVDIACMAAGLEPRSPLLDHEVMELAASFPTAWKLKGHRTKRILIEAFPDVLPRSVTGRPKQGFGVPIGEWLRKPESEWLRDVVTDREGNMGDILNIPAVERMWIEHQSGTIDHGHQLWNIVMLSLWGRMIADTPLHATQQNVCAELVN